ncbi:hypothetical protein DVH24_000071 [Malus domestica]|uniref:Uncharacterized protein n=1 Tax=Malus domestica TaxID=3750 RepID=A0A498J3I3_MALDO|nr:hypothetical protein DVH24_000071 [Malus domestica]
MSTRCMVSEVLEPSFFDFDFDLCLTKALRALMALRSPLRLYKLESLKVGLNLAKFRVSVAKVWRLDSGRTPPSRTPLLRCKVNHSIFELFLPVCFIFLTRLAPFCLRARLLDGVAQFTHNKVDLDSVVELITKIKLWALSLCLFWIGDSLLPIPL